MIPMQKYIKNRRGFAAAAAGSRFVRVRERAPSYGFTQTAP